MKELAPTHPKTLQLTHLYKVFISKHQKKIILILKILVMDFNDHMDYSFNGYPVLSALCKVMTKSQEELMGSGIISPT